MIRKAVWLAMLVVGVYEIRALVAINSVVGRVPMRQVMRSYPHMRGVMTQLYPMQKKLDSVFQTIVRIHIGEWIETKIVRKNEELFLRSELTSQDYEHFDRAAIWFRHIFWSSEKGRKAGDEILIKYFRCLDRLYRSDTYETVRDFKQNPEFHQAVYDCIDDFIRLSERLEKGQGGNLVLLVGC